MVGFHVLHDSATLHILSWGSWVGGGVTVVTFDFESFHLADPRLARKNDGSREVADEEFEAAWASRRHASRRA